MMYLQLITGNKNTKKARIEIMELEELDMDSNRPLKGMGKTYTLRMDGPHSYRGADDYEGKNDRLETGYNDYYSHKVITKEEYDKAEEAWRNGTTEEYSTKLIMLFELDKHNA